MSAPFWFTLPPERSATAPPERRGIARDRVRLMLIDRQTFQVEHSRFDHLGNFLRLGDLLIFNFELQRQGVETAHIVLHTRLDSYMDNDLDAQHLASEEEYFISEATAAKINQTHQAGGRVIAVGTTVVRALESAVDETGEVQAKHDYTRLRITKDHKLKAVEGLLTGLHEPEASHLDLLTAFLPAQVIQSAYGEAVQQAYLWHEFGDLNLIV